MNICSLILFLYVFASPAIWNAGFMASLSTAYGWQWAATTEAANVWSIIPKVIVGISIFGYIVETITVFVRALLHGERKA
jgi:ABC-type molybdate transport system permease subunit